MDQLLSPPAALPSGKQSPHHLQEDSLLLQQPLDILYILHDYLSVEDVTSLSLSCKHLHGQFLPTPKRLKSIDRHVFLPQLEKDLPGHCYCHGCKRLHAINSSRDAVSGNCLTGCLSVEVPWRRDCVSSIVFNQARAAMNSHFFGADHGIQLDKLGLQSRYTMFDFSPQVSCLHKREATIIDDELFIAVSREYESKEGDHGLLRALAWMLREKPCSHVFVTCAGAVGPHGRLVDRHSTPGSCDQCLTDWEATVHLQPAAGDGKDSVSMGWKLIFVSFHQLGSCRSPKDWKWTNMHNKTICRQIDTGDHTPGSVRRKWAQGPLGSQGKEPDRCATEFGPWSICRRKSTKSQLIVESKDI